MKLDQRIERLEGIAPKLPVQVILRGEHETADEVLARRGITRDAGVELMEIVLVAGRSKGDRDGLDA